MGGGGMQASTFTALSTVAVRAPCTTVSCCRVHPTGKTACLPAGSILKAALTPCMQCRLQPRRPQFECLHAPLSLPHANTLS